MWGLHSFWRGDVEIIGRKVQRGPSYLWLPHPHTHIHVEKQTKSRRYQNQDAAADMVKLLNSWVTPRTHYKASCCSFINTATSLLPSSPTSQLQQLLIYLHFKTFYCFKKVILVELYTSWLYVTFIPSIYANQYTYQCGFLGLFNFWILIFDYWFE